MLPARITKTVIFDGDIVWLISFFSLMMFQMFLGREKMTWGQAIHSPWRLVMCAGDGRCCLLQQNLGGRHCALLICGPLFQGLRTSAELRSSLVAQWVKGLVLSLLWLWLLLWHKFDPWLGKFCMPWVQQQQQKSWVEHEDRVGGFMIIRSRWGDLVVWSCGEEAVLLVCGPQAHLGFHATSLP